MGLPIQVRGVSLTYLLVKMVKKAILYTGYLSIALLLYWTTLLLLILPGGAMYFRMVCSIVLSVLLIMVPMWVLGVYLPKLRVRMGITVRLSSKSTCIVPMVLLPLILILSAIGIQILLLVISSDHLVW